LVALPACDYDNSLFTQELCSQDMDFAMREVRLLQQVNHVNVVRMLEAYQSASGRLYLVFEYVDHTVLQMLKACPTQSPGLPPRTAQVSI
jgi:serine/threonine protein kinase